MGRPIASADADHRRCPGVAGGLHVSADSDTPAPAPRHRRRRPRRPTPRPAAHADARAHAGRGGASRLRCRRDRRHARSTACACAAARASSGRSPPGSCRSAPSSRSSWDPFPVDDLGWYLVADADPAEPELRGGLGGGRLRAGAVPAPPPGAVTEDDAVRRLAGQTGNAEQGPVEIGEGDHAIRWIAADPERRRCAFAVVADAAGGGDARPGHPRHDRHRRRSAGRFSRRSFDALGVRGAGVRHASTSDCAWALVIVRVPDAPTAAHPSGDAVRSRPTSCRETARLEAMRGSCGPDAADRRRSPVFSATDLVGYLACEHLTALERGGPARRPVERPHRNDRELEIIRKRGFAHEARYLAELARAGRDGRHDRAGRRRGARRARIRAAGRRRPIAAMAAGADVIYQATFFDGRWLGYADFLLRVEIAGAALALGAVPLRGRRHEAGPPREGRRGPPDLLVRRPARAHPGRAAASGCRSCSAAARTRPPRCASDDYMAYYRAAKERFEAAVLDPRRRPAADARRRRTYPEPVEHCDVCRWAAVCAQRRRDDDHLSLVAGITAPPAHGARRRARSTPSCGSANAPLPLRPAARRHERREHRARPRAGPHPGRRARPAEADPRAAAARRRASRSSRNAAWPCCPPPDAGDLFLDLEGDPYAFDDGVDYLFGVLDTDGAFTPIWSFDPTHPARSRLAGEKAAFERAHGPPHRPPRALSRACTSTTTPATSRRR